MAKVPPATRLSAGFVLIAALVTTMGCEESVVATRAPGAEPLDEAIPPDTTPGPVIRTLVVNLADGVVGTPPSGSQRAPDTTTIAFSYQAASGFENVLVQLDGKAVSTSGTINMVADRELSATADRRLALSAGDLDLVTDVRALLTSSDLPGDWAAHRAVVDSLYQAVGAQEARERMSAVYTQALDPVADSTDMRTLVEALGGQAYASATAAGETLLLFVNGLVRWPTEPAWVEADVRAVVGQLGLAGVVTGHFYNDTPTRTPDFTTATCMLQAASRHFVSDPIRTLVTGAGFLQWPVLYGACVPLVDLDDGRQAVLDALGFGPAAPDPSVTALAALIQQQTAAAASIVLVAHSQGNLLVQRALQTLGGAQSCVGVISLAAPTSAGWPAAGEEFGAMAVPGDIALASGQNAFPATDTDVAATTRDLSLAARSYVAAGVADLTDELFPHLAVESYLAGDASLASLEGLIASQVSTLQQRTACGGP